MRKNVRQRHHARNPLLTRPLLRSPAFIRAAKKALKKNPQISGDLAFPLKLLEEDAFHPYLKTHKLTGILKGSLACSVAYDLRIVFSLVRHAGREAILLETFGTHDEVY